MCSILLTGFNKYNENHIVDEDLQDNVKVGVDDCGIKDSLDSISKDEIVLPKLFDDHPIVQDNFQDICNHKTIGDVFQVNCVEDHFDSHAGQSIYDMCLDDLEKQSSESTPMEFFSSEALYGKYDSDVLKNNEGDGKELEEQLTHFSCLLVVEQ